MTKPVKAAESSANTARSVGSEVAITCSIRSRCNDSASDLACRTDWRNEIPSRTKDTASTTYPTRKCSAGSGWISSWMPCVTDMAPPATKSVSAVGRAACPPVGDEQEDLVAGVGPRMRRLGHQRRRSGHHGGGRLRHRYQHVGAEGHQHRREALRRAGTAQQRHRHKRLTGSPGNPLGRYRCRGVLAAL